jgi:Flp pilus assembly protein TadD
VRENYSDWDNKQISPPLPPVMLPPSDTNDANSQLPIQLGIPGEATYEAHVTLPSDYTAALPQTQASGILDLDRKFASYHASVAVKNGVLNAERHIVIKQREIPPAQRDDYNSFRTAIDKSPYYVVLNTRETTPKDPAMAEADRLVLEGEDALRRHDLRLAQELFRQATEKAPKHSQAWRFLGYTYLAGNDTEQGLALMRKQIEISPSPAAYVDLGQWLRFLRRPDEELKVFQQLLSAYPQDTQAQANLGWALLELKRYSEAVPHLKLAVESHPEDIRLYASLGETYLGEGDVENGRAALKKMVELQPVPNTWNNCAYILAEHNTGLDDALRYSQMAVKSAEEKSATLTLESSDTEVRSAMGSLHAYWDTLGWVYFRRGDLENAQRYLSAAWDLSQSPTTAEHLAQVYLARKDTQTAAKYYARAAAVPVRFARNSEEFKKLVPGAANRERMVSDAREELSKLRTTHIRRVSGPTGAAEFEIIQGADGKIEAATLASGDEKLKAMIDQLLKTPLKGIIPSATPKLVRRAMLMCSTSTDCDFVLVPVDVSPSITNSQRF